MHRDSKLVVNSSGFASIHLTPFRCEKRLLRINIIKVMCEPNSIHYIISKPEHAARKLYKINGVLHVPDAFSLFHLPPIGFHTPKRHYHLNPASFHIEMLIFTLKFHFFNLKMVTFTLKSPFFMVKWMFFILKRAFFTIKWPQCT